jgi:hypothetical protein
MKFLFSFILLTMASAASAQDMTLENLFDIMDKAKDSAAIRTQLFSQGFDHRAVSGPGQVMFMGDTAIGVTKYTEMVFMQSQKGEVQVIQYCTRHPELFYAMRTEVRNNKAFTGQPSLTEEGELSEAYYTQDYQMLFETMGKKTRFVVSVWVKGAK